MNDSLSLRLTIERWTRAHAVLMILAVCATLLVSHPMPLAIIGLASFVVFGRMARAGWQVHSTWGGPANLVTSLRLLLMICLGIWGQAWGNWIIGGVALLVLVADGLDGYLARKYETASEFGAQLDQETDAYFVMMMSSLIWTENYAGAWVLSLGLIRYAYVLFMIFFKPPEEKESRSFRGQLIAVILMASLIACFWLPEWIYFPALVIAALLLAYSFGISFWESLTQSRQQVQHEKQSRVHAKQS